MRLAFWLGTRASYDPSPRLLDLALSCGDGDIGCGVCGVVGDEMSDLRRPVDAFSMIDWYGKNEFNDAVEERRYQEFKDRLVRELVARVRSPHTAMWIEQELHDTTKGE